MSDMCVFWYLKDCYRVFEQLTVKAIIDGKLRDSIEISNLSKSLIVCYGVDRADSDVTLSIRLASREDGNSSKYTIPIAQYENGAETYDNEAATLFNPKYPLQQFLQDLVDDNSHTVTFTLRGKTIQCDCFMFCPTPKLGQCIERHFAVQMLPPTTVDGVIFDPWPLDGLPPKIAIPEDSVTLSLRLVVKTSKCQVNEFHPLFDLDLNAKDTQYVVGCQFLVGGEVVYTHHLRRVLKLSVNASLAAVEVETYQNIGYESDDIKQILIQMGICSASAKCSCPCCIAPSELFNRPSERLQRRRSPGSAVVSDFPRREGRHSIDVTSERFDLQSGGGNVNHANQ